MIQGAQELNLARKWRPKTFDQVVGQDVPIRILKNSLYLNKLFPVYLFAGQRGCGKTSTARVFAAAVNCASLTQFQRDPLCVIPCLACQSCSAMKEGTHPDFIEIDAASNTGVDNVRQIIDSSAYMPICGQKKIYLIDEAHMLSKAAFNAFLKLLEEPPASVLFVLATTESQKIPPTVLSRCFQALFAPIKSDSLKEHIRTICDQEQVSIDEESINLIVQQTEGSARDAINLLERVRFVGPAITKFEVLLVLGKLDTKKALELLAFAINRNARELLAELQAIGFEQLSPNMLWDQFVHLCRGILWIKYGVVQLPSMFEQELEGLQQLASLCSLNRINAILQLFWSQEELFLKTSKKHLFLESVLLQVCEQVNVVELSSLIERCTNNQMFQPVLELFLEKGTLEKQFSSQNNEPTAMAALVKTIDEVEDAGPWAQFVQKVAALGNPFLTTIFSQSVCRGMSDAGENIMVQLASKNALFRETIEEHRKYWLPFLQELYGCKDIAFVDSEVKPVAPQGKKMFPAGMGFQNGEVTRTTSSVSQVKVGYQRQGFARTTDASRSDDAQKFETVATQDQTKWPQVALISRFFPGKVKGVKVGDVATENALGIDKE